MTSRFEKVATPPEALTVLVEPLAKLPGESVSLMLSLLPVPEVIGLPNWSSTLTPVPKAVPAVIDDDGGWVVTITLLGVVATMVKPFVMAVVMVEVVVLDAVMV